MGAKSGNLFYYSWKEAKRLICESDAVMVPLGSVEEHGPHLPLGADTLIAEHVSARLCNIHGLYYYPCIPYGQVWSAKEYPGTISVKPEHLKQYLKDVLLSLRYHGAKRVICYSFHNGNVQVIRDCMRELRDDEGIMNVYHIHVADLAGQCTDILDTPPWRGGIWHAGELETSLLLYLEERLVDMEKAPCIFPDAPLSYAYQPVPWSEFNEEGSFGDSSSATTAKGREIYDRLVENLSRQIKDILKMRV